MDWKERISLNPQILVGKPVVTGTRISVELVVELLAGGWTNDDILRNYPGLEVEDIRACLQYAAETLKAEKVYPIHV